MHQRISVSGIYTYTWSREQDLALYAEAGITNVDISAAKLDLHG